MVSNPHHNSVCMVRFSTESTAFICISLRTRLMMMLLTFQYAIDVLPAEPCTCSNCDCCRMSVAFSVCRASGETEKIKMHEICVYHLCGYNYFLCSEIMTCLMHSPRSSHSCITAVGVSRRRYYQVGRADNALGGKVEHRFNLMRGSTIRNTFGTSAIMVSPAVTSVLKNVESKRIRGSSEIEILALYSSIRKCYRYVVRTQ